VDVTGVARIFLDQLGERRYLLSIVDRQVPPILDPEGILPDGCTLIHADEDGLDLVAGFAFECTRDLTLDDTIVLPWNLAGVVALARWSDGTEASAYFPGKGGTIPIRLGELRAEAGSSAGLAADFFTLGVEHIVFGLDHLLFVLGLLLLVRGVGPLVATITAFTVAHSLTLAAAVLGVVPVSPGPVEAAIALSIVLLAREIVTGHRGERHLVHRAPWLVAFGFGLLHGLGFAGALGEIGLRGNDLPVALLSFNVGVEAGQLAFVGVLLAVNRIVPGTARGRIPKLEPTLGYALGALAMFWFLGRLPAVWGA
jgi:hydrogenase/urease accessory protein HupE